MEKGQGKNSWESTSKKDQATNGHRVERAGVGEVGEDRRVGHSGQKGCRYIGEDNRDEVKDSRGQPNFLAGIQRGRKQRQWRGLTREKAKR